MLLPLGFFSQAFHCLPSDAPTVGFLLVVADAPVCVAHRLLLELAQGIGTSSCRRAAHLRQSKWRCVDLL